MWTNSLRVYCLSERPIPRAHRSPSSVAETKQVEYRKVETNYLVQPKTHEQRLKRNAANFYITKTRNRDQGKPIRDQSS
jgi:hypothetical protein